MEHRVQTSPSASLQGWSCFSARKRRTFASTTAGGNAGYGWVEVPSQTSVTLVYMEWDNEQ
eukprot:11164787-Lingulodinium_polyedra.AAC.1